MNFEEKINEELKNAMKNQDKVRIDAIRSIRSAIIEFNKSGSGKEMTQDEEIKLLNSLAKKRKESIEMYNKGNRPELAQKEAQELAIIQEFLPKQLNDDEAKEIIQNLIAENNARAKDFGKMMGLAMKMLSGKYEGAKVQAILKELLQ
ncbi:MAG: GatB/YqeY domain-containing protein [Candidatus Kapaibacteriota bacterium]